MGIAGLLNNYKLFDTNYYSMMAHLIPVCIVKYQIHNLNYILNIFNFYYKIILKKLNKTLFYYNYFINIFILYIYILIYLFQLRILNVNINKFN